MCQCMSTALRRATRCQPHTWTPPPHLLGGEDVVLRLRGGGGSDGGAKAVRGDAGGGGLDAVGRRPPRSLELL